MKQLKRYNTLIYLGIIIAFNLLVYRNWYFNDSFYYSGDFFYFTRLIDTWRDTPLIPYIWTTRPTGLGMYDAVLSVHLVGFFSTILSRFISSGTVLLRLTPFIPMALITPLSSFFLIKGILKKNFPSFVGSLVYSYNVYALANQARSQPTIMLVYALAPLAVLFYIKYLRQDKGPWVLATTFVISLTSVIEFRIFYILFWVLVLYLPFHIYYEIGKFSIKKILTVGIYSSFPFLIAGVLNLYWLFPIFAAGNLGNLGFLHRGTFGDTYFNLKQSLTFFYPWWASGQGFTIALTQDIPFQFWLIPIFVFAGFYLNRRNKFAQYFLAVSILGIMLTKQAGLPFPGLYAWLFDNFPGFNAFREATKFYLILALGYMGLISFFAYWVETGAKKLSKDFPHLGYYLVMPIFFIFIENTIPVISGKMKGAFEPRQFHGDYIAIKDFLQKDTGMYRHLWVPADAHWSYYDQEKLKVNLYKFYTKKNFFADMEKGPMTLSEIPLTNINAPMLNIFEQEYANEFLDTLSIKYVIVPVNDTQNGDLILDNYGVSLSLITKFLDAQEYLERVDAGTQEIVVYENADYKPQIFVTKNKDTLVEYEDAKLSFERISPVEFNVKIDNLNEPVYLFFSQSYNPGWKLYFNKPLLKETAFGNPKDIDDKYHEEYGYTEINAFYIDPSYIKSNFSEDNFSINKDGSISLNLVLFFSIQNFVYIGILLTLVITPLLFTGYFILRRLTGGYLTKTGAKSSEMYNEPNVDK